MAPAMRPPWPSTAVSRKAERKEENCEHLAMRLGGKLADSVQKFTHGHEPDAVGRSQPCPIALVENRDAGVAAAVVGAKDFVMIGNVCRNRFRVRPFRTGGT